MKYSELKLESNKIILADLDMEDAALHDLQVLQSFIASRYQSIGRIQIHRMTQPEKNFTGNVTLLMFSQPGKGSLVTSDIEFMSMLGRKLGYALTQIRNKMITKINFLSDEVVKYQAEVMNMFLTFDALQSQLKLSHIQNCCFEDFEHIYKQALYKPTVRLKNDYVSKLKSAKISQIPGLFKLKFKLTEKSSLISQQLATNQKFLAVGIKEELTLISLKFDKETIGKSFGLASEIEEKLKLISAELGVEYKFNSSESTFTRIRKKLEIISKEVVCQQKFYKHHSSGTAHKIKEKLALMSQELGIDQKFILEKSSSLGKAELDAISIATILQ